ncbi:hypothetical protein FQA39_LY04967 [Lamprigera yunnana]|nr:hypothetical protein FQA39_LY04967 [Lamprigera yunnana]
MLLTNMLVFFYILINSVFGANILYISPIPAPSHHIWNRALALGLNKQGHNVTILSHYDDKIAQINYTTILLEDLSLEDYDYITAEEFSRLNPVLAVKLFYDFSKVTCEYDFNTTGLKMLVNYPKDFKFDLVVFDVTSQYCLYPLIKRFQNPPVVAVTPFLLPPIISYIFGNPLKPAYFPYFVTQYSDRMNFQERFLNFVYVYSENLYRKYIALPSEMALAKKYFGEDIPSFEEVERNISMLLCNTDSNFEYPLDLPPNIISVGGLHLQPPKPLPEDLKAIVENAKNGVIIFSLGSIVKSNTVSDSKRTAILNALAKLSETVIWKFEDNNITNLPNNVIVKKWLPQSDLMALAVGLNRQGHNVTILSHYEDKIKQINYTTILLEGLTRNGYDYTTAEELAGSHPLIYVKFIYDFSKAVCEYVFNTNGLETLMNYPNDFKFDLVVFDVTSHYCLYPLIKRFQSPPVVAVTPFLLPPTISYIFGNPLQSAYFPYFVTQYSDKMNFQERFLNFLYMYSEHLYRKYNVLPSEMALAKKYFGEDIPSFEEVERNISILLCNTNSNLEYPLDLPPNIISVGGLHVQPPKPLPEDLKAILENAKNGVIIFSLGTVVKSSTIGDSKRTAILNALSKLSETVIWKFEDNNITNLPNNVIIKKWLPQSDLIAQPNVKLLINHGGALSTQEAIHYGVPVVAIPFIADQFANAARLENKKLGKIVDFKTITSEGFYSVIREVLDNAIYTNNIKAVSKRYSDRLNTPLETAVFWVEYILRHGSAEHLNIAARDMYFFQWSNLDVIAVLILGIYLLYTLLSLVVTVVVAILKKFYQ